MKRGNGAASPVVFFDAFFLFQWSVLQKVVCFLAAIFTAVS
jgi:hypothetical protein